MGCCSSPSFCQAWGQGVLPSPGAGIQHLRVWAWGTGGHHSILCTRQSEGGSAPSQAVGLQLRGVLGLGPGHLHRRRLRSAGVCWVPRVPSAGWVSRLLFALQPPEQPPYPHHQGGPPHCPPWNNSHEGMWGEQRGDPGWNGQRDAPWNSQPDPNWNNQFEGPWNSQHEQPPWGGGQREPPFRMQRPPHFRGPFPPHQQHPQFSQPPHPHNFNRFPPRFMQDDFPPRHPFERPPYPHRFDYPQGDFQAGECKVALGGTVLGPGITSLSCPVIPEKVRSLAGRAWKRRLTDRPSERAGGTAGGPAVWPGVP